MTPPPVSSRYTSEVDVALNGTGPFTVENAAELYRINEWGRGYFAINDQGRLVVQPNRTQECQLDLKELVDQLTYRDLDLPILLRFSDVLRNRVKEMHDAFAKAIDDHDYAGRYRLVYPIKVNQQRQVVEEIVDYGKAYGFGVEAGSKPELLAVMAIVNDDDTPIICNGFKDAEYIEAVILAAKMGRNIIPVVEKFSELELITKYSKLHRVRPQIGLRVKLAARGAGRWEGSGGEKSKFGLFISEVVEAVHYLQRHDMHSCLKLLHFHLGSQINNIRNVKSAIIELARVYVEMHAMGCDLTTIDVGGGLGVDYDGSNTNFESSINYSLQEYANDVIFHVRQICNQAGVQHPTIMSESGRALVAYHSVLVFNVVGSSSLTDFQIPDELPENKDELPAPVRNLFDTYRGISEKNAVEYFHDAQLGRDETINLFNLGYCSLEHRALAETLYFGSCSKVLKIVREMEHVPEDFNHLESTLAETFFCNFSLFQSLPDSWAIDQLFPIMPIHRLNERPTARGILADITCDSDGKVDRFIDLQDVKHVLELHPYTGEDYLLGAFLIGAYQEILGDLHNLFGDTNAVHISVDENGEARIEEVIEGDTVREVLEYVQFNVDELMRSMRKSVESALKNKKIELEEARALLRFYESGLKGYTYLEGE